tara:strand:- start:1750 stop:2064 length:315 start_codon:yes stop_codon:yes gene_type:complete
MIDDEDVLAYVLNEILEAEQMANVFKAMMEYEDYPFDWLMEQFLIVLNRVDEMSMTDRAGEFHELVQKMNFRKMDANTGEIVELDDDNTEGYEDSIDSYNPWER